MCWKFWARVFPLTAAMAVSVHQAAWTQSAGADDENASSADSALSVSAAQWWQFVFSIPVSVNPTTDATGADCGVGQRGDLWFLVGLDPAGILHGPVTRNCTLPEGKALFFPVINNFALNTPGVCGQTTPFGVGEARQTAKTATDSVTVATASFDGRPLRVQRETSRVFDATFPADNLFVSACSKAGGFPAGVYSPGVDDGYYALVGPLRAGKHVLRIHGEQPDVVQDIVYNLKVVPVQLR